VVTNGFYEWKKLDPKSKIKQAYAVDMASSDEMVMAGLWSKWRDPASGEEILSCAVLTCAPNEAMAEKHPRSLVRTCQMSRRKAGMTSHPKRRRDSNQLAKSIVDIATGEAQERPLEAKSAGKAKGGAKGG
jgi:putative SOS response-associated peptidase YedK